MRAEDKFRKGDVINTPLGTKEHVTSVKHPMVYTQQHHENQPSGGFHHTKVSKETAATERPPTHSGVLVGVRPGYEKSRIPVDLHETKNAYHSRKMGTQYRKDTGDQRGNDWPTHKLDITSVKAR